MHHHITHRIPFGFELIDNHCYCNPGWTHFNPHLCGLATIRVNPNFINNVRWCLHSTSNLDSIQVQALVWTRLICQWSTENTWTGRGPNVLINKGKTKLLLASFLLKFTLDISTMNLTAIVLSPAVTFLIKSFLQKTEISHEHSCKSRNCTKCVSSDQEGFLTPHWL